MSQSGFTPIQLYYSTTASQAPSAGNLTNGELALNITDGKLFYKDNGGVVQVLATKGAGTIGGATTQVQYNLSGALAGSANMTFDGTTLTAAGLAGPHNGTVGATTPASGAFTTLSASSTLSVTGAGTIQGLTVGRGAGAVATNTAVGASALAANTTGISQVALGNAALDACTTGNRNTAVGDNALGSVTTGDNNLGVGRAAGLALTTGVNNTFVGAYNGSSGGSGEAITTGSKNTILGSYNGNQGGLDIRTASNYIVLSDGDGNPRGYFNPSGYLKVIASGTAVSETGAYSEFRGAGSNGYELIVSNVNATPLSNYNFDIRFSNAAPNNTSARFWNCNDTGGTRAYMASNGGLYNYQANNSNLSDRREKTNFAPAKNYLDVICAIPVQTFNYIDQNLEEDDGLTLGVVAQDVQAVAPELVMESNWASKDEEPKMRLSIYQTDLQYALMKALQELKTIVDAQAAEIAALKGQA